MTDSKIKINKNSKEDSELLARAVKFCEEIEAIEIFNIARIGDGDWRLMYIGKDGVMRAKIFEL